MANWQFFRWFSRSNKKGNGLSTTEYLKECDEDILSILILHSLEYEDLLKLDGPFFPLNFEVWNETSRASSHFDHNNYTDAIPSELVEDINGYLKELLLFPSEKWTHYEFDNNTFWKKSREKAKEFVKKLNIQDRGYWR